MINFNLKIVTLFTVLNLVACGGSGSSTTPPVPNTPPTAVVPADFEAVETITVSLNGTLSTDDKAITSYLWEQTAGDNVSLTNADTVIAGFIAPDVDSNQTKALTFRLTVTDADGATATDSVTVTVVDTPAMVTLSGKITYDLIGHTAQNGLDYNNITQSAVRGATVELLSAANSSLLQATSSDVNGDYSFAVNSSTSYIVRVKAELKLSGIAASWDFTVVDNTNSQALYTMQTGTVAVQSSGLTLNLNAASGWTGSSYGSARVAAPFAILDDIYQAKEKVLSVDASVFMRPLKLNWSVNNVAVPGDTAVGDISTSHFNGSEIFILGDADADTDEYDDHVIIHEWGHYFESSFSRSDSVGGSHGGGDKLDPRVAVGEGFGNALSGIVTDDSFYRDSFGASQSQGFSINVETNPVTNKGWFSESSVQSILYDLYDANDDGSDNLTLGFAPIYEALINGEKNTEAFTTIFSLATQIKLESPSNAAAIDALLASQNISAVDEYGSTETNNGGDARNLPIYKNLPIDGGSVEVCSFPANGQHNKLGNRQYMRFEITAAGSYQFTAVGQTTGDDPDINVFNRGLLVFKSDANGDESTTQTMVVGQYVMDVYEFVNVQGTPQKDTCIDVTLSSN